MKYAYVRRSKWERWKEENGNKFYPRISTNQARCGKWNAVINVFDFVNLNTRLDVFWRIHSSRILRNIFSKLVFSSFWQLAMHSSNKGISFCFRSDVLIDTSGRTECIDLWYFYRKPNCSKLIEFRFFFNTIFNNVLFKYLFFSTSVSTGSLRDPSKH